MLELETLIAFSVGAVLVAVAPVVTSVTGRENRLATSISATGRNLTKQGIKLVICVADRSSDLVNKVGHGLSEAS